LSQAQGPYHIRYTRGEEPIYYHGPRELCNIAGGPQKFINFIREIYFYLPKQSKERKV